MDERSPADPCLDSMAGSIVGHHHSEQMDHGGTAGKLKGGWHGLLKFNTTCNPAVDAFDPLAHVQLLDIVDLRSMRHDIPDYLLLLLQWPYPIAVAAMGMAVSGIFGYIFCDILKMVPPVVGMDMQFYFFRVCWGQQMRRQYGARATVLVPLGDCQGTPPSHGTFPRSCRSALSRQVPCGSRTACTCCSQSPS